MSVVAAPVYSTLVGRLVVVSSQAVTDQRLAGARDAELCRWRRRAPRQARGISSRSTRISFAGQEQAAAHTRVRSLNRHARVPPRKRRPIAASVKHRKRALPPARACPPRATDRTAYREVTLEPDRAAEAGLQHETGNSTANAGGSTVASPERRRSAQRCRVPARPALPARRIAPARAVAATPGDARSGRRSSPRSSRARAEAQGRLSAPLLARRAY